MRYFTKLMPKKITFKIYRCENIFKLFVWLVIIQSPCQLFFQPSLPLTSPCLYCTTCFNILLRVISYNLMIKSLSNSCSIFFLVTAKENNDVKHATSCNKFRYEWDRVAWNFFQRRILSIICHSHLVYTGNF